jgi:hypothetical protein
MVESNWVSSWTINPSRSHRALDNQSQAVNVSTIVPRPGKDDHRDSSFSCRNQNGNSSGADQTSHWVTRFIVLPSRTSHRALVTLITQSPWTYKPNHSSSGCWLRRAGRPFSHQQRVGAVLIRHLASPAVIVPRIDARCLGSFLLLHSVFLRNRNTHKS